MVSSRDNPHPFRLGLRLHRRGFDLTVPEGLLLHRPDLLAARLLTILHVRPQPDWSRGWGSPVWELHCQADSILGASGPELLSSFQAPCFLWTSSSSFSSCRPAVISESWRHWKQEPNKTHALTARGWRGNATRLARIPFGFCAWTSIDYPFQTV